MKKRIKFIIIGTCILSISTPVHAATLENPAKQMEINNITFEADAISDNSIITTRANFIGWRYKNMDGHVYKRQYNYSKKVWIGEWILC